MQGITFGDTVGGDELPPWRAIVEADGATPASGDVAAVGNPIVQGVAATNGQADPGAKPAAIGQSSTLATAENPSMLTTAMVEESSAAVSGAGDIAPRGSMVVESRSTVTAAGNVTTGAVAIGAGVGALNGASAPLLAGLTVAGSGSSVITGAADLDVAASAGESVQTFVRLPPEMLPLIESHSADQLEDELKELFILMFETHIRPDERYANVMGMPQLGPSDLINQSLSANGLSIYRGAEASGGAGAYLLRAWRSMNPKRGKHLLETYLQLLWPNVWTAEQMWQSKDVGTPYPTALVPLAEVPEGEEDDYYLTSRINVRLPSRVTTGGDLAAIQSGLRAAIPARMVMNLAIESEESFGIGLAAVFYTGAVAQSYEGSFI